MSMGLTIEELKALIEVGKMVNAHLDLDTVLKTIMAVTEKVMKVEASSLVLVEEETGDLLFHLAGGSKAEAIKPLRMKPGEGIVGQVVQSGESMIVNDVENAPGFCKRIDDTSGFKTEAILCVPLKTENQTMGAIEVLNKTCGGDFDEQDKLLCEAIAGQASMAIKMAMLHEQVVNAERLAAIGQTMAGMAHCIKNVLSGLHGGSYMVDLGLRKDDNTMMSKGWGIVKKSSSFIEDLVLDMLTYTKEREPEYEPTDLNEITEAACELMNEKASAQGTSIARSQGAGLEKVLIDPKGIQRCLLNLVSNAVDACSCKENGRVDVCTENIEDEVCRIKVSDNGVGISDEDKAKLFQVFFSTKGTKGTGLGLAVTHKIISEHKGNITVESEFGKGTTFTVTLPMRHEAGCS